MEIDLIFKCGRITRNLHEVTLSLHIEQNDPINPQIFWLSPTAIIGMNFLPNEYGGQFTAGNRYSVRISHNLTYGGLLDLILQCREVKEDTTGIDFWFRSPEYDGLVSRSQHVMSLNGVKREFVHSFEIGREYFVRISGE